MTLATALPTVPALLTLTAGVAATATAVPLGHRPCRGGLLSGCTAGGIVGLLALTALPAGISTSYACWTLLMVALLAALAVFDALTRTVPDALTVPLILAGMLHSWLTLASPLPFIVAPLAIVLLGVIGSRVVSARLCGWVGDGDVLIVAGSVAWLGPFVLADYILLSSAILATSGIPSLVRPSGTPHDGSAAPGLNFAFAPAAAIAQIVIWLCGPVL